MNQLTVFEAEALARAIEAAIAAAELRAKAAARRGRHVERDRATREIIELEGAAAKLGISIAPKH